MWIVYNDTYVTDGYWDADIFLENFLLCKLCLWYINYDVEESLKYPFDMNL